VITIQKLRYFVCSWLVSSNSLHYLFLLLSNNGKATSLLFWIRSFESVVFRC